MSSSLGCCTGGGGGGSSGGIATCRYHQSRQPDLETTYSQGRPREGVWSLRAIDVATRRQSEIYSPGSPCVYVRYPDWSRSGDVVVFERGDMRANIWSLAIGRQE